MINEAGKEKIRQANIANIVRKTKAGKTLTAAELKLIDGLKPEPKDTRITVEALASKTGIDRRTIKKRLIEAALYPPNKFPAAKVLDAIRPPPPTATSSIREKKTHEEWRKLKLANDAKEKTLTDTAWICERIQTAIGRWRGIVQQKFVNEGPERMAMQDLASVREIMRALTDEADAELAGLAGLFEARPTP